MPRCTFVPFDAKLSLQLRKWSACSLSSGEGDAELLRLGLGGNAGDAPPRASLVVATELLRSVSGSVSTAMASKDGMGSTGESVGERLQGKVEVAPDVGCWHR